MLNTLVGVFCGVLTGLVPGLHINTFLPFLPLGVSGFVVGVVVAHSFFDFLPSIFLGVPDESNALSVLPAHRMVLEGHALRAFQLSVFGGLFSSLIAFLLLFLLFSLGAFNLRLVVLFFLVLTVFFMFFSARSKVLTFSLFLLAGFLGLGSLGKPHALFALLSGFFGSSTILYSLFSPPFVKEQKFVVARLPGFRAMFFGGLAGIFSGLMPGLGSSISALGAKKLGCLGDEDFLVLLGGVNTVYAFTAVFAIFLIGKPRSGAALFIRSEANFLYLAGSVLLALGVSALLAFCFSGFFVRFFNRIPLRLLNVFSLFLLVFLALFFDVFFLFIVSTCLGLACVSSGVRRSTCMGSLLLPAILYYLP